MKILFSWLLDHLDCTSTDISITNLIHLFNIRTAEIESYQTINFDKKSLFLATVQEINQNITLFCPELQETLTAPTRTDVQPGKHYLIIKKNNAWHWASLIDCGSQKEGLMPALHVETKDIAGAWKNLIPDQDFVLEVDNKSINHRPDLWGHYGIAREVSTFLNIKLKSLEPKLTPTTITHEALQISNSNLHLEIQNPQACSRIAALVCNNVTNKDSLLIQAIRLAQVDSKPMSSVVDLTNYVMLDIGHPMHAFDASAFADHTMIARMATEHEKLQLLDGTDATLSSQDIVIANKTQALSLAGVMGGKSSSIQPKSTSIILEAAGFDPLIIRKTAQRLKLRTESSMRFEKHLDPMQNITAIQRFLFLAMQQAIIPSSKHAILSVGQEIQPATATLNHQTIEKKLGNMLDSNFIIEAFTKLGFGVQHNDHKQQYIITIPTYRLSKDIKIEDDLIEEIIRSYGFENIKTELPTRPTRSFDMTSMVNIDRAKQYLAFGMHMHEIREYLMYDAAFIQKLPVNTNTAIKVRNPMSQNWTTLVTSLIPHLLKAIENNQANHDQLRFFEINRIWPNNNTPFVEKQSVAGIMFDKKNIDFYESKQALSGLFDALGISVAFKKPIQAIPAWYHTYQTTEIFIDEQSLGFAGILSAVWMKPIGIGSAFIFELDGTLLETIKASTKKLKQWSKFQDIHYDISLLIPKTLIIEQFTQAILNSDSKIQTARIIDFIEKAEWPEHRAVTIRYIMNDDTKTMTKEDIDLLVKKVESVALEHNAKIR